MLHPRQARVLQYHNIILSISDIKEVNTESNQLFSNQIMKVMHKKVEENFKENKGSSSKEAKLTTTKEMIRDVTKISQMLIVVVRTIFKDHKNQVITSEGVQQDLEFLKNLWLKLDKGGLNQGELWERRTHKLLKQKGGAKPSLKLTGKKEYKFNLASNFLHDLIEENGDPLKRNYFKNLYHPKFIELIWRLIHF
jgi:hypothetical protein